MLYKEQILKRYPFLQARKYDGTLIKGEIMGLEIPKGWYKLFFQMCEDIKPHLEKAKLLDKFYFLQVKEKFNDLRCYVGGESIPEVSNILRKYELMAHNICCICGRPAEYETTGYIASYCNDCWKDYARHKAGEFFTPQTSFKVVQFSNGNKIEKEIFFKEEWERYLKESNL